MSGSNKRARYYPWNERRRIQLIEASKQIIRQGNVHKEQLRTGTYDQNWKRLCEALPQEPGMDKEKFPLLCSRQIMYLLERYRAYKATGERRPKAGMTDEILQKMEEYERFLESKQRCNACNRIPRRRQAGENSVNGVFHDNPEASVRSGRTRGRSPARNVRHGFVASNVGPGASVRRETNAGPGDEGANHGRGDNQSLQRSVCNNLRTHSPDPSDGHGLNDFQNPEPPHVPNSRRSRSAAAPPPDPSKSFGNSDDRHHHLEPCPQGLRRSRAAPPDPWHGVNDPNSSPREERAYADDRFHKKRDVADVKHRTIATRTKKKVKLATEEINDLRPKFETLGAKAKQDYCSSLLDPCRPEKHFTDLVHSEFDLKLRYLARMTWSDTKIHVVRRMRQACLNLSDILARM